MGRRSLIALGLIGCLQAGALAVAATTAPSKVVQQYIEAHRQGRFAAARALTIEQADLSASLFSNWLFGSRGAGADVFLSRKFVQVFRYSVIGSTASGDNRVQVSLMRTSPSLVHMYMWALVPKRGATPYELIEAIDTYLTKVNYPIEKSRMEFTLIREADEWYISVVHDEKFAQLQQQGVAQQPLSATAPAAGTVATAAPAKTTTSEDSGRQIADAQFNATLQSFNRPHETPASDNNAKTATEQEKPSLMSRIFGSPKGKTVIQLTDANLKKTFKDIRDALDRYTTNNQGLFPASDQLYDWQSLRRLVNFYGKRPLPTTEEEAGFSFVNYTLDTGSFDSYTLLVELHQAEDGAKRLKITPNGVEEVS